VKIIVPYAAGAATDTLSRLLAQALGEATGATYIVDNRSGAGTQIGTRAIAGAAPDGQTLGFIDTAFAINPGLLGAALPYDTQRDFVPISLMATAPLVLVVHASVPARTMREFIALAKARPGTLNYGSAGVGSAPHLAGEQLHHAASIDINHVPYRGGSTVLTDLIGGQIQMAYASVLQAKPHIEAGRIKVIGTTGDRRMSALPQVPTLAEQGRHAAGERLLVATAHPMVQAILLAFPGAQVGEVRDESLDDYGLAPLDLPEDGSDMGPDFAPPDAMSADLDDL